MQSIVAFLALILSLLPRAALADSGAVIVSGKVAERDRTLAMGAAEDRVRASGWELVGQPFTAKEVDGVTACLHDVEAWPCVSKIVEPHGVRRVAAVALKRNQTVNGTPQLVITERLVLADAELVVLGTRFCEQCTDDTLSALTIELTNELLQRAALDSGRTVLAVQSTPQGSRYSVDGVLGGATDATITIVPGTHVVTIEHAGYESETRTIESVEGKTSEVVVTLRRLEPIGNPGRKHDVAHRSRALPIAMVAVGSAAIAGGLIALASNQRDVAKPPDEDQPRWRYDTVPAGITAIVGGAAIASIGGCLWWKYSRDDARPIPMVTPVVGGAVIGVHGAF
jgi:hypothetical protein